MNAIQINPHDNVVVAVEHLVSGDTVCWDAAEGIETVIAQNNIPLYHKVACRPIAKDEAIVKYGEHIGRAKYAIATGEHVHTHNVISVRENLDQLV